mmetsp:Transcript_23292/g.37114  ORF Transcript_23292/g.37114 Transcript_23292/m.37114 type:complete len:205 (+) Transcript_23292:2596-3210(+)
MRTLIFCTLFMLVEISWAIMLVAITILRSIVLLPIIVAFIMCSCLFVNSFTVHTLIVVILSMLFFMRIMIFIIICPFIVLSSSFIMCMRLGFLLMFMVVIRTMCRLIVASIIVLLFVVNIMCFTIHSRTIHSSIRSRLIYFTWKSFISIVVWSGIYQFKIACTLMSFFFKQVSKIHVFVISNMLINTFINILINLFKLVSTPVS